MSRSLTITVGILLQNPIESANSADKHQSMHTDEDSSRRYDIIE